MNKSKNLINLMKFINILLLKIFMQFIKEYGPVNNLLQEQIRQYIDNSNIPFELSKIYRSDIGEKLVNLDTRLSEFRLFTEKYLFDLCEQLVNEISEQDKNMSYMLVKNDITHIRYNKGGYFKSHEDYLSLTTNIIEEHTLIMCLKGGCIGGETVLHFNDHFSYPSKATITANNILIFRKDLQHEGALIQDGTKEILTMNLWAFPKKKSDAIVIVSFANDTRTHVIAIHNIMNNVDNLLKAYIHFTGLKHNKNINFHITDYTWEDFDIIAQIYNGQAIPYEQFAIHQNIIDYYGFNWKNLLIKNFHVSNTTEFCIKCNTNDNIMICDSLSRYEEQLQHVKEYHLPYMPFKVLFAEGIVEYGGGMCGNNPTNIKMSPVWASFSERNNIMFYHYMISKSLDEIDNNGPIISNTKTLKKHKKPINIKPNNKFDKIADLSPITIYDEDSYNYDNEDDDIDNKFYVDYIDDQVLLGLTCCVKKADPAVIVKKLFNDDNMNIIEALKSGNVSTNNDNNNQKLDDYYVIDTKGRLAINPNHFEAIYDKVNNINLYNSLKTMIKTTKFIFPQITHNVEHFFCNEQIYGNFTFLMVYGFMKME